MDEDIEQIVSEKITEYNKKLAKIKSKNPQNKDIDKLLKRLKIEIKQLYIIHDRQLRHITTVAPEDLEDGKIKVSHNRANNYETEFGDWVFASSEPINGQNAYMARQRGMILITDNVYIYGGDIIDVREDEEGRKHAILKRPNYSYEISPENFTPVVEIRKKRNGEPYFEFSKEWTSEEEIDISDQNQVSRVVEITDVTDLLHTYQVLCDVKRYKEDEKLIGNIIRGCKTIQEGQELLEEYLRNGDLRYINGECGINEDERFLFKHQMGITNETVREFARYADVQFEKENSSQAIESLTKDNSREENTNARS